MKELKSEFLYSIVVKCGNIQDIGETPNGHRIIVKGIEGCTFEGPKMKGIMIPGGGDWLIVRPDGSAKIDVRDTLLTDDGEHIYISYNGYMSDASLIFKIMNGEQVDPSSYYFRTTPYFETASKKYAWLNTVVAIGIGEFNATGLTYDVHAIL